MKNSMHDLRNHLFETIERLKDPQPETPMDISTATAIVDVAKTLIDSARVENEYLGIKAKMYPDGLPAGQASETKAIGGWIGESSHKRAGA